MSWFWEKKSLVAKLAEVSAAIGGVAQEGHNELDDYWFQRWRDIAKMVRGELSKRGIVLLPQDSEIVSERPCTVTLKDRTQQFGVQVTLQRFYEFTDGKETLRVRGIGVGEDIRDKALQKADTGALKYMLRDMFLIPNVEDNPEEVADLAEKEIEELRPDIAKKLEEQAADFKPDAVNLDAPPERIIRAWNSLCKTHGKTVRQRRDYLSTAFGVKTFAELNRDQADQAIVWAANREELEKTLAASVVAITHKLQPVVAVMDSPNYDEASGD